MKHGSLPNSWKRQLWCRHRLTERSLLDAVPQLSKEHAKEFAALWPADEVNLDAIDRLADLCRGLVLEKRDAAA